MATRAVQSVIESLAKGLATECRSENSLANRLYCWTAEALGGDLERGEFAAQAAHLFLLLDRFAENQSVSLSAGSPFRSWLIAQRAFPWNLVLPLWDRGDRPPTSANEANWDDYGPFLRSYDEARRNKRGVYYTPVELADFVVAEVDRMLPDGLTAICRPDSNLVVQDPAVGSGVFLTAVLRRLKNAGEGNSVTKTTLDLRRAVSRLQGVDILFPACGLAYLQIGSTLAAWEQPLDADWQLQIQLGDSLIAPQLNEAMEIPEALAGHSTGGRRPCYVILGNPPFSGISQNRADWIERLMRDPQTGYFQLDGQPLGERKVWLNDDYVKFFRVAQDRIERAGEGLLAFVTNHAMLDNASFRGMRSSLLRSFPRQRIVDLHGSRKRDERKADGRPDENVFQIEQGVAVCLLQAGRREGGVQFGEAWGTRAEKLDWLRIAANNEQSVAWQPLEPRSPHYLLAPNRACDSFAAGRPLTEVFPIHSTAPVTARDGVVVAFEQRELEQRIAQFRDLRIDDQQMRREFFPRQSDSLQRRGRREREYLPGDTRGWKMTEARRHLAKVDNWWDCIRPCLYRPFDWRSIYWAKAMVDWPRPAVSKHLENADNIVLIARRLTPPNARGVFVWACSGLALDGVIRSDNRGSESLFPLMLRQPTAKGSRPNLDVAWLQQLEQLVAEPVQPDHVAAYIYAQLQSDRYQQRFADNLRQEFPRVFMPANRAIFETLVAKGRRLLNLHLPRPLVEAPCGGTPPGRRFVIRSPYPRWSEGVLQLASDVEIEGVSEEVWTFHVGSHQICRKWWRDRRGRQLGHWELLFFAKVLGAIGETLRIRAATPGDVNTDGFWA